MMAPVVSAMQEKPLWARVAFCFRVLFRAYDSSSLYRAVIENKSAAQQLREAVERLSGSTPLSDEAMEHLLRATRRKDPP